MWQKKKYGTYLQNMLVELPAFLLCWDHLHSLHFPNFGATLKQSASCKKLSPVFFRTLIGGLLKGFSGLPSDLSGLEAAFFLPPFPPPPLIVAPGSVSPSSEASVTFLDTPPPAPLRPFLRPGLRPRLPLVDVDAVEAVPLLRETVVLSESLLLSSLSLKVSLSDVLLVLLGRLLPRPPRAGVWLLAPFFPPPLPVPFDLPDVPLADSFLLLVVALPRPLPLSEDSLSSFLVEEEAWPFTLLPPLEAAETFERAGEGVALLLLLMGVLGDEYEDSTPFLVSPSDAALAGFSST